MDLICFCHIRWNFVYQRPQHLMNRFSKYNRVFFIEEPIYEESGKPFLGVNKEEENIWIVTPHLVNGYGEDENLLQQRILISSLYTQHSIENYIHWYYTPMALTISSHLQPEMIIYDCMDELANFKSPPANLRQKEKELFSIADLVFTGGHNLYKAKMNSHSNIFPFPSSIDKEHFEKSRHIKKVPKDAKNVSRPVFGFYGVIDERFDIDLLREVASLRPDWNFCIIGPVVKIEESSLPRLENIHYLGPKKYEELPQYLSGWDVALIPFLLNDSTRYISPTKTPEYLAAGIPVISSSIVDVVNPYAINNLVHIADDASTFIKKAEQELAVTDKQSWLERVDEFLKHNSWDQTWYEMTQHMARTLKNKRHASLTISKEGAYV